MTSRSTTESPSKARTSQVPQAHRRDSPRSMVGTDPIYPVEADRYHLYVSLSCPWSHRVAIARGLLGLEAVISMVLLEILNKDNLFRFAVLGRVLPEQSGTPVPALVVGGRAQDMAVSTRRRVSNERHSTGVFLVYA